MQANRTSNGPAAPEPLVFIVDDDEAMRRSVGFLLRTAGLKSKTFGSAREFLDDYKPGAPGCLLLDVRMPGMSGLELQEHLRAERITVPVVILTAYGDVAMAVRAMKAGAVDFIEKPFEGSVLLDRIRGALAREARVRVDETRRRHVTEHLDRLTPREREVMDLVVAGLLNKQIAAELGISMKTVEIHRARVMEKMQAESLAELVRMAVDVEAD